MNTNHTLHFDPVRLARFTEVGIYASLAIVLISQLFYHQGVITRGDASLVGLGVILGLMASCNTTPVSNLFARWRSPEHTINETRQRPGDVLPFNQRELQEKPSQSGETSRRAA